MVKFTTEVWKSKFMYDLILHVETFFWFMPGEKLIRNCKYLALLH